MIGSLTRVVFSKEIEITLDEERWFKSSLSSAAKGVHSLMGNERGVQINTTGSKTYFVPWSNVKQAER